MLQYLELWGTGLRGHEIDGSRVAIWVSRDCRGKKSCLDDLQEDFMKM